MNSANAFAKLLVALPIGSKSIRCLSTVLHASPSARQAARQALHLWRDHARAARQALHVRQAGKGRRPSLRSPRDIWPIWNLLLLATSVKVSARRGNDVAAQTNARRAAPSEARPRPTGGLVLRSKTGADGREGLFRGRPCGGCLVVWPRLRGIWQWRGHRRAWRGACRYRLG